ncbi:DUF637 domain-containing protein [Metapseudomonas otitidis]|uniref:DUF637 domain-containing protein n=2 Tax=Metapseudomonas otitidis TaxID=319939 RepID=UPI0013F6317C|nr:DUF637 domain-containing protein [Pseudomonas otitidis]
MRNVGTQVTSGGNLTLASEGDQLYQRARLESGGNLTLDSGGAITFEAVKELHQESHEKSKSSFVWNSMSGKGNTDETVLQSQLIAQGEIAIKAVEGLKIDVKQIDQKTVSETIDVMVSADPQLAWLKDAEKRGDIDWRRVKEVHDSFKYSHSGLGGGAQIIIAIIVTYLTAGAGSVIASTVSGAVEGGLAGTVVGGVAQGAFQAAAVQGTISTINNRGNLGAIAKDMTSKDAVKGYVVGGVTAGLVGNYSPGSMGFNWQSVGQVAKVTAVQAGVKTAVYGGSLKDNLKSAAVANAVAIAGAAGADVIGGLRLETGSFEKVALHATLGGLLSEAMGGDFRTGAIAAGANELMLKWIGEHVLPADLDKTSDAYREGREKLLVISQLVGALAAGMSDGNAEIAAAVAANATANNYLRHQDVEKMVRALEGCDQRGDCKQIRDEYLKVSDENRKRLAQCKVNGNCPDIEKEILEGQLAMDQVKGYAGQVLQEDFSNRQWVDRNTAQQNLIELDSKKLQSLSERSQVERAEYLQKLERDPQAFQQELKRLALEAYQADLEQKLLKDVELQRLSQLDDAELDRAAPGWREDQQRYLKSVNQVKSGMAMVGELLEPDALDLLGPAHKLARLAGIYNAIRKAGGKVSADILNAATKLSDLAAGKAPSPTDLAGFKKSAEANLAEQIRLANQTLASKSVGSGAGVDKVSLGKDAIVKNNGFTPAPKSGMKFDVDIKGGRIKQIDINTNQKFDQNGSLVDTKFTRSFIYGTFDESTGILHIDKMASYQQGHKTGREMISRLIEAVGVERVKMITAELADTNKAAFKASLEVKSDPVLAIRDTPLGKALKDLGFNKVNAKDSYPFPQATFVLE